MNGKSNLRLVFKNKLKINHRSHERGTGCKLRDEALGRGGRFAGAARLHAFSCLYIRYAPFLVVSMYSTKYEQLVLGYHACEVSGLQDCYTGGLSCATMRSP